MATEDRAMAEVLRSYPKAIAHLRLQLERDRFGLVFGAGASTSLGFPSWTELVRRIGRTIDPAYEPPSTTTSLPVVAEVLFQRLLETVEVVPGMHDGDRVRIARARWRERIKTCLYRDVPSELAAIQASDACYQHFVELLRPGSVTVNYNFDDTLGRIVQQQREVGRAFEVTSDLKRPQRNDVPIIYHPNGYLPRSFTEQASDELTFGDESFADLYLQSLTGSHSPVLHHFMRTTCLLVGLSLGDESLRHLLRQNTVMNPGHVHYYVNFTRDELTDEERRARTGANFDTYNLVTLFLDADQIAALGRLLTMPTNDLMRLARKHGVRLHFTYYLSGVPGVGKTTTLGYFHSLNAYTEFVDPMISLLQRPFDDLSSAEIRHVDEWVRGQFAEKNLQLHFALKRPGISVVERCPLDPLTFNDPSQIGVKARGMVDALAAYAETPNAHPGEVLLMSGDPEELSVRARLTGKEQAPDYLRMLQEQAIAVFRPPDGSHGVRDLYVARSTREEVVRRAAREIYLGTYCEADISGRLRSLASSS